MKTITHKLWPVSYIDSNGEQQDQLYNFDPQRVDKSYWVGKPIEVIVDHIDGMPDDQRAEKIAYLKEQLAKLEANDV